MAVLDHNRCWCGSEKWSGGWARPSERIDCDVLVVGGGINGAGIARDAAGRGLRVVLCEKDDLAAHTSSASSKLIHGGLRYLEHREFGLVRKALIERELLLRSAPHIMWPLRFVMPHDAGQRPALLIRAGLFLYDRLARREFLPGSRGVDLRAPSGRRGAEERFRARFRVFRRLGRRRPPGGAGRARRARTRRRRADPHAVQRPAAPPAALERHTDRRRRPPAARQRALPGQCDRAVGRPLPAGRHRAPAHPSLRLVKGSHIVVRRLFDHAYAYIFQHPDGRIVFAMPYEREFTLIGTTDLDFKGDLDDVAISDAEIELPVRAVEPLFPPADRRRRRGLVVFRRAPAGGGRARQRAGREPRLPAGARHRRRADADRLRRQDHHLPQAGRGGGRLDRPAAGQPRTAAGPRMPACPAATCSASGRRTAACSNSTSGWPACSSASAGCRRRWCGAMRAPTAPASRPCSTGCRTLSDLGPEIVPGLYAAEADYLMTHEWASQRGRHPVAPLEAGIARAGRQRGKARCLDRRDASEGLALRPGDDTVAQLHRV